MTAGTVNQSLLQSFYQNAGQVYDDNKTEGAFATLSNQIDDNWYYLNALNTFVSGLVNSNTAAALPFFNYRQSVINGNFDIWQRSIDFVVPGGAARYVADRWLCYRAILDPGMKITRQPAALNESTYCLRAQRVAGNTSVQTMFITQPFESVTAQKFKGKTLTLSLQLRKGIDFSGTGGAVTVQLVTGTGTDESGVGTYTGSATAFSQVVTPTTNFTTFTFTTAPLAANVNEFYIAITYQPTGTAGTFDYVDIAQVQLSVGTMSFPFAPKSFSQELIDCQRYYEKSYDYGITPGATGTMQGFYFNVGQPASATVIGGSLSYKVKKRIIPTVTVYDMLGTPGKSSSWDGSTQNNGLNFSIDQGSESKCRLLVGVSAGNYEVFGHFTADAEL